MFVLSTPGERVLRWNLLRHEENEKKEDCCKRKPPQRGKPHEFLPGIAIPNKITSTIPKHPRITIHKTSFLDLYVLRRENQTTTNQHASLPPPGFVPRLTPLNRRLAPKPVRTAPTRSRERPLEPRAHRSPDVLLHCFWQVLRERWHRPRRGWK